MIIPVLDIKNGIAVRGKGGARETYKPLKTVFHHSSSPLKIAGALSDKGAALIYIADLDAIESKGSNLELIKDINDHISVMLDCGASNIEEVEKALEAADKVIVATETLKNIEDLNAILKGFGERIIISIDIKNGEIYSKHFHGDLHDLIKKLKELKPNEVILLDISGVGSESGFNKKLIGKFREIGKELIIGGGIREVDINGLKENGLNKFLVGSALHNGKLRIER